MRRLIVTMLLLLLVAAPAWAAGTIAVSSDTTARGISGQNETRAIAYTVTWDAAHLAPANIALNDIKNSAGTTTENVLTLKGWWLLKATWVPGTTGPTDDTDLYLWRVEDKIDALGAGGLNEIDESTNNTIYPATSSQPLFGTELIDFDNNSVNSATGTLTLYLYR